MSMRILAAVRLALPLLLLAGCTSPRTDYSAAWVDAPDRYLPPPPPEPRPAAPPRDLFTQDVVFLGEEALDGEEWPDPTTGSWDDGSPVDRGDGVLRVQPQRRWHGHRGYRRGGYRHGGGRYGSQGCAPVAVSAPAPTSCAPAYQQPVSFRERWQR